MSPGDSNVQPCLKSYWLKTIVFKFSMPQTHLGGSVRHRVQGITLEFPNHSYKTRLQF